MCGRARCTLRPDDVPRACHRSHASVRTIHMDRYRPTNNVAPGWGLPVLRRGDSSGGEEVVIQCMKWGLVPSFTKKIEKPDHYKMFNARSETVNEKASFRRLMPKCRCLVAFEGFYEWKKDASKKQPYYIHFKDGRPLVFAALYDSWVNSEGEELYTFTILTTSAAPDFQWLHDRMPVILGSKESTDTWLGGSSAKFDAVLKPYEGSDLVWYPVTPAMGKPSFDGPECIKEIHLKAADKNLISKFFAPKKIKEEEEEINLKQGNSPNKSMQVNVPETFLQEAIDTKPLTETNPSLTNLSVEGSTSKFKLKREYEEFSADSLTIIKESNKHPKSPATKKKKKDLKGSGNKQPTLFSYFGKS